jgi:uncharacterized membrane protein (DUF485 family)
MTTDEPEATSGGDGSRYLEVQQSAEFEGLRRAFRRFVFPATIAFLVWYALYVILSAYARDFMGTKVFGNINVALIFGLLQFVTTFLIAWLYERYATRTLEPQQESLKAQVTGGPAAPTVTEEEPA